MHLQACAPEGMGQPEEATMTLAALRVNMLTCSRLAHSSDGLFPVFILKRGGVRNRSAQADKDTSVI